MKRKKISKVMAFILIFSMMVSVFSFNALVVQAKDVFPVTYKAFDDSYTLTGYQIGKSDDGKNTTVTLFGPNPGGIVIKNGSFYTTLDCMITTGKKLSEGGTRYESTTISVTGEEKIVYTFDTAATPVEVILLLPPKDDGWADVLVSFVVADTPQKGSGSSSSSSTSTPAPKPDPKPEPKPDPKPTPPAEPQIGDRLGDVLNSDVKTYINGNRIPCYNIKNKAVVLVADLRNYGFDVVYDNKTRTSTITRNYNKQFTPIQGVSNTTSGKAGTVAFSYVYTDIVAILDGKKIESFNVQGNLAIYFESLGDYGTFAWDNATKSSKLTLKSLDPTGISISSSSVTVDVGKTVSLTATVTPSNAGDKTVTWSSSNANVATVSNSGVVKGVAKGTATITAKTSNGKTSTCTVTVKDVIIEPNGISISSSSATIDVGKTVNITATVTPPNSTDSSVTWSSSNTKVATVSSSGVVTGVAAGTATITAKTSNGKAANCTVTVKDVVIEAKDISVSPSSATIDAGKTVSLTATVTPSNSTDTVTWSSSNTKVATVSSSGVVTGVSKGTVTITAKTSNGKTSTCTVTVNQTENYDYYPGTKIRTFTDVTGTKLKEIDDYSNKNGIVFYIYNYIEYNKNEDNMFKYLYFLEDDGFQLDDYKNYESRSLFVVWMSRGNEEITVINDFKNNEVWVVLEWINWD